MNGDNFDKVVSRLTTTQLTSNTSKVTELPDDFEPLNNKDAEKIANLIK